MYHDLCFFGEFPIVTDKTIKFIFFFVDRVYERVACREVKEEGGKKWEVPTLTYKWNITYISIMHFNDQERTQKIQTNYKFLLEEINKNKQVQKYLKKLKTIISQHIVMKSLAK